MKSITKPAPSRCSTVRRTPVVVKKIRPNCDANNPEEQAEAGIFGNGHKILGQFTYKPTIALDIFTVITIGVEMYLYIKYAIILKDPAASSMFEFNLLNIFFCVVGRFIWGFLQYRVVPFDFLNIRYNLLKKSNMFHLERKAEDSITGLDLFLALVIWLVVTFTQLIRFVKLNVSALDQFLFYVFAAPAEEDFFRFFLISVAVVASVMIVRMVRRREVNRWEEIIIKASVGFIVGVIFGLAHSARYTQADLFVIILNGVEFSVIYAFTRRIDMILFAHLALNIRAGFEVFL